MMTVKGLMAKLKKLPPGAHVVWQDHDQGPDELSGFLSHVAVAPDELLEARDHLGEDHPHGIVVLS